MALGAKVFGGLDRIYTSRMLLMSATFQQFGDRSHGLLNERIDLKFVQN